MILYLDTNILLARYSPREPGYTDSKKILDAVERGDAEAVTSIITLVEVTSSVSRSYNRLRKDPALKREEVAGAFLKRIVSIKNLSFIPLGGEISLNIEERTIEIPALLAVALELAPKTGVKTLDNLHIASAVVATRIYGQKMDYFVTLDEDLLRHGEEIASELGATVAPPSGVSL